MFLWFREHLPALAHIATILVAFASIVPMGAATIDLLGESRRIQSLIGVDAGDRGPCKPDQRIEVGEFCVFTPAEGRFRVAEGGASPPGQPRLAEGEIKVDWDSAGLTFQAAEIPNGDGAWWIEVAGAWHNAGSRSGICQEGDVIEPGQFCIEPNSRHQFRVYATDELVEGDNRPLYEGGYAVLFWWEDGEVPHPDNGRLHDQVVVSGDNFEAVRRSGASWEIVRAN